MKIAIDNLNKARGRYKSQYDKRTKQKKLEVGEQVLLLQPNKQNILQTQWTGPYPIVQKIHENNYRIKINGKLKIYHANRMKLFIDREEENTPVQNASFIDYEVEDQYHEEVVEGLDTIRKDSPEDYRINKDLNAGEMN